MKSFRNASATVDSALCSQCGVNRADPTPQQKGALAPPCWNCILECIRSKGAAPKPISPGCKKCLGRSLCDLDCARCGVWLHWTALVTHGAKAVEFTDYPAAFRVKYCAALGQPAFEIPYAVNFLRDLLWQQRAFEGTDKPGPLDGYLAELRRVFSAEPVLLGQTRARFEKELLESQRWQAARDKGRKP